MALEYVIYADESADSGPFFSNFYGGALVRSTHLLSVRSTLEEKKASLSVEGEIKWSKVTDQYLNKYVELIEVFFDLVREEKIKVRVMFTQNYHRPLGLTDQQRENRYHLLYYQFLKHSFGLPFSNDTGDVLRVRLLLDQLPGTHEQRNLLKAYIASLQHSAPFRNANIVMDIEQIVEVESHGHVIMQCLDVVLGSIHFRLNDLHRAKPEGKTVRGKRTRAKEKLYKTINARIRGLYPGFNIGMSTGFRNDRRNLWLDPYRHWLFKAQNHSLDRGRLKK